MKTLLARWASWALALAFTTNVLASPAPASVPAMPTPAAYARSPDQTFLTFPEWYLVYSPAEYATFVAEHRPQSAYPFFGQIAQFWQGYAAIAGEIRRYPFNGGYHLMVMVIGLSTTVEYTIRGIYEATIGRIFEALTLGSRPLPEDVFAARYARAYVDFIRVYPWYEFDFRAQLKSLWSDYPLGAANLPGRLERRYALTTELLAKTGYAWLIKLGTRSVYAQPSPVTAVTLTQAPRIITGLPQLKLRAHDAATGQVLVTIPRYQAFTTYSLALAAQGENFTSIAGNAGEVVASFLGKTGAPPVQGRVLFTQPILTQPGLERWVIAIPIAALGRALRSATRENVTVEHIYDF